MLQTPIRLNKMENDKDYVLTIDDLEICFDVDQGRIYAVNGVTLKMERGKTLAVVGESGCGKTVAAHAILKLIEKPGKITDGKIVFYPANQIPISMTGLNEKAELLYRIRGGAISMIFQEPMTALSPVHTIGSQICESISLHYGKKISRKQASGLVVEMLKKVGIPQAAEKINCYPFEMSGGMRQRAMIAMAMITKPELLIADEPTTALDVTIQAQIIALMKQLRSEYGTSVMLITHDFGVVAQSADNVAVMYLGRIVEQAPVREMIKNPVHPYTKALLKSLPILEIKSKRLTPIRGSVPTPWKRPLGCPFHPRCDDAQKGLCDTGIAPKLNKFSCGHYVACFRAGETVEMDGAK